VLGIAQAHALGITGDALKLADKSNRLKTFDISGLTPSEVRQALLDGTCDGATWMTSKAQQWLVDKNFNEDCTFEFVGEPFYSAAQGWAVSLHGQTCPHVVLGGKPRKQFFLFRTYACIFGSYFVLSFGRFVL
jgi:hypothetical protein